MNNELMFSSVKQDWETDQKFWNSLDEQYQFCFDLACSEENCKTANGFTEEENSLEQEWAVITTDMEAEGKSGWLWLNPPYDEAAEFVDKAWFEMTLGAKIVMLLPARTDTKYFHNFLYNKEGVKVEFIKGRLTFGSDKYWSWVWEQRTINGKENKLYKKYGKKTPAPFPSMLVIFNKD